MSGTEEEFDVEAFEAALMEDDYTAAREHLAAGFPIYYVEPDTPPDLIIKHYPDGRRELVSFENGAERFVSAFSPSSCQELEV